MFRTYTTAKPICIGMFTCELPLAILTLSGRHPHYYDQDKSPILWLGFYLGGAGGYRPRVRRTYGQNTTGIVYFSVLAFGVKNRQTNRMSNPNLSA